MISMKLGYSCLYVTIIPDGGRLGHVCCEDPLIGGHDNRIEHALKVLIAAGLAEGRHFGSPTWGDADDRVNARRGWSQGRLSSAIIVGDDTPRLCHDVSARSPSV